MFKLDLAVLPGCYSIRHVLQDVQMRLKELSKTKCHWEGFTQGTWSRPVSNTIEIPQTH